MSEKKIRYHMRYCVGEAGRRSLRGRWSNLAARTYQSFGGGSRQSCHLVVRFGQFVTGARVTSTSSAANQLIQLWLQIVTTQPLVVYHSMAKKAYARTERVKTVNYCQPLPTMTRIYCLSLEAHTARRNPLDLYLHYTIIMIHWNTYTNAQSSIEQAV